jgi:hypothetical protein
VEPSYGERLRRALKPQTEAEHQTVDYLAAVTKLQASTVLGVIERRTRTARRYGQMHVAQRVLAYWEPNMSASPTEITDMEFLATGGDPSTGTADDDLHEITARAFKRGFATGLTHARAEHEDPAATGRAYDRGWNEAVAYCRAQQERGLDPELWDDRPGGGDDAD